MRAQRNLWTFRLRALDPDRVCTSEGPGPMKLAAPDEKSAVQRSTRWGECADTFPVHADPTQSQTENTGEPHE